MEVAALNAIRSAMRTFSEQRAPANTGCALQAKFLRNVLLEYEMINARSQRSGTQPRSDQHSRQNHNSLRSGAPMTAAPTNLSRLPRDTTHQTIDSPIFSPSHVRRVQDSGILSAHDDESSVSATPHDPSVFNLDFANDDVWALIFANAGFNIDQGTFLLSA